MPRDPDQAWWQALSELDEGLVVSRVNHTQLSDVELLQLLLAEFGIRAFDKQKAELVQQAKLSEMIRYGLAPRLRHEFLKAVEIVGGFTGRDCR